MSASSPTSSASKPLVTPGSNPTQLQSKFAHGVKTVDGVRYLLQGREVQNAFGLQSPPIPYGKGLPPHAFQVPYKLDSLPDYTEDPLFKVIAPGTEPGAYTVHMDRPEVLFSWMNMYGGPTPSSLWCWGMHKLIISNRALFQTNFVPLVLIGLEMRQLAEAINIVHATHRAGRRLVIAARPTIPRVMGTQLIETQLGEAPPREELIPIGNHLATVCLTQM